MLSALITGVAGPSLTAAETAFLCAARPCGIILFARNCREEGEIRALIADAKEAIGTGEILVLVDQEGGRVQRLKPPLARALPPAAAYGRVHERDPAAARAAAHAAARLVAEDLRALGINANCAPVLDVPVAGAHDIIGDRAYGSTPGEVAALGRAVVEGLMAGGVLPVIKHIPGHGRATRDSHLALPVVDAPRAELAGSDFAPFKALSDMPAAMTAHVVFTAIDPESPASTSATVVRDVIRGEIGFGGLLMSDDLSMKALSGSMRERAAAVMRAGCDVALHCNGDLNEMEQVAAGVPALSGAASARFAQALPSLARPEPFDVAAAEASLSRVLATYTGRTESV